MMIEIFTKLPLKIQKFQLLFRQAVRNSLKIDISCDDISSCQQARLSGSSEQGQGNNKQMFVDTSVSVIAFFRELNLKGAEIEAFFNLIKCFQDAVLTRKSPPGATLSFRFPTLGRGLLGNSNVKNGQSFHVILIIQVLPTCPYGSASSQELYTTN